MRSCDGIDKLSFRVRLGIEKSEAGIENYRHAYRFVHANGIP